MKRRSASSSAGMTLLELLVVLVILVALGTLMIPTLSWMGQRSQRFSTQENLLRLREILVNKYYVDMGELPRPRLELTSGGSATRVNHPQLVYLFVNPDFHEDGDLTNDLDVPTNALSGRRWQGPYVMHSGSEYFVTDVDNDSATGTNYTSRYGVGDASTRVGDPTIIDAWGNPIVIQEPDVDENEIISSQERQYTRIVSAGRNGIIDTPADLLMPTDVERFDDEVLFIFRHDEFGDERLQVENE